MKEDRPPGAFRLMLALWIFAVLLAATVVVLMVLRGPAVVP